MPLQKLKNRFRPSFNPAHENMDSDAASSGGLPIHFARSPDAGGREPTDTPARARL